VEGGGLGGGLLVPCSVDFLQSVNRHIENKIKNRIDILFNLFIHNASLKNKDSVKGFYCG
jgi:hypothetical protein